MDILLYLTKNDGVGVHLKNIIERLPLGEKLEVYNSIETFDVRLRNTLYEGAIARNVNQKLTPCDNRILTPYDLNVSSPIAIRARFLSGY